MAKLPLRKWLSSRAVLVDTGPFVALYNKKDDYHQEAIKCFKLIAAHRLSLFISVPTIYESHRRILFDSKQVAANSFLDSVFDGSMNVERTLMEDEQEARQLMAKYAGFQLTLTDAVNMAIMVRLQIGTVFSFDSHFLQGGFVRIPPFYLSK